MIVSWFDQTLISNNAAAATTSIEIVPVILNYRHIQQTAQEKNRGNKSNKTDVYNKRDNFKEEFRKITINLK